jgi:arylsulfatase A-like enzyme
MEGDFGFARGFDHYERVPYGLVYADRVNRRAFELLDARGDDRRPLFLFLHYIDPHSDFFKAGENALPYYAPAAFLEGLGVTPESREFCDPAGGCATEFLIAADRESRPLPEATVERVAALYGRGVAYLDNEVGELVAGLRERSLWDDSLVFVTSDHGEEFREHGRFVHVQPYVESLAVPLLIKLPGAQRAGTRIAATVETVDYLPTLLDAAGVPSPPHVQGRSLLPLVRGEEQPERPAFGRDKLDRQRFALRLGRSTLVHHLETGRCELYDRVDDPGERHDLADQRPQAVAAMRATLLAIIDANRRLAATVAAPQVGADVLTEDEAAKLRAIGYLE